MGEPQGDRASARRCAAAAADLEAIRREIERVVVGQRHLVDGLLVGLLAQGHVLLEGPPGLAKTLAARTLTAALGLPFRRIQFTPDLLPGDIVGTMIFDPRRQQFVPRRGPIFANIVLADEINRAPAKVQAALLEAMEERRVTLGDKTWTLPQPFLVIATQNPIEQQGTYELAEAQLDRFLFKIVLTYPDADEERRMLDRMAAAEVPLARPVVSAARLGELVEEATRVHVAPEIRDYIVAVVRASRAPQSVGISPARLLGPGAEGLDRAETARLIRLGASPRATLQLLRAARGRALLDGRPYVLPDDVRRLGADLLRHRLLISYEGQARGLSADRLIKALFAAVPPP